MKRAATTALGGWHAALGPLVLQWVALIALPVMVAVVLPAYLPAQSANPRQAPSDATPRTNAGLTKAQQSNPSVSTALAPASTKPSHPPDLATQHFRQGSAYAATSKWDQAITEYRIAIQLKPAYADAHNSLGVALATKGDDNGAVREYQQALRFAPNDAEAHNNLGVVLAKTGDLTGAVSQYQAAVKLKPDFAEAWFDLGAALMSSKQIASAMGALSKAASLKPDWAKPHFMLARSLESQKSYAFALAEYLLVLRLKPGDQSASSHAGVIYDSENCWKEGAEQFRTAIAAEPNEAALHAALGYALYGTGDLEAAATQYEIASKLNSTDKTLRKSLKKARKGAEKHNRAKRDPEPPNCAKAGDLLQYIEGPPDELPGSTRPVARVGGEITPPIPLQEPYPGYTALARKAKFEGTVVLSIVVDTRGHVRDVRLLQGIGMGLDENAIDTVKTWRVAPTTRNGVPVAVKVTVEVSYHLFRH